MAVELSTALATLSAPKLFVAGDSLLAGSIDPPSSTNGASTAKGSYVDGSGVVQRGVINVYAENPARVKTRAAHLLSAGDEIWLQTLSSGHPLASKLYTVTVTAADEFTLNGIDATSYAAFTSAAQTTDGLASVDIANANRGFLTWANYFLDHPWDSVTMRAVPGRTSAQVAAAISTDLGGASYSDALLLCGRNDASFDQASLDTIYAALIAACDHVNVLLPYPDGNANAAMLTKVAAIADYWFAKQASDPKVRVIDLFGVFSDAAGSNQASRSELLSADLVHPRGNGAMVGGYQIAQHPRFQDLSAQRRAVSRVGVNNLLTNGRLKGVAGTTNATYVTGVVPDNWTFGARSSGNITGCFAYPCRTPARQRLNSTAYVQGETVFVLDDPRWWYVCTTAGTSAASQPAGYGTVAVWDWTGVTDGTAVFVKIPRFTDSQRWTYWFLYDINGAEASPAFSTTSFYQSIALPASVSVGDRVQAECESVIFNLTPQHSLLLSCIDGSASQLARAHDHGQNSVYSQWAIQGPLRGRMKTPSIRVPSSTATLELRIVSGANAASRSRFAIANPLLLEA